MKQPEKNKRKSDLRRNPKFSTNPKQELKKVSWPNRESLVKSTVLILVLVVVLTTYVTGADYICSKFFYLLRDLV